MVAVVLLSACQTAPELGGYTSTRYRGRWGDGRNDHDVTQLAAIDVGDPAVDRTTLHVMGDASWDVDGNSDDGEDVFFGLSDTFQSRLTGRLYHAYVDVHRFGGLERLRVGRQLLYDTPEVIYLDGVSLETTPRGERAVRAGLYTGIPTHPFESSASGDFIFGAFAEGRPASTVSVRADWLHLEDTNLVGNLEDDLLSVSGTWQPRPEWILEASHSRLAEDPRDVRLAGRFYDVEGDFTFQASYYELLATQDELPVPLDPFFATLFELFPYRQLGVLASKGAGSFLLQAGADVRRVSDETDVGEFNRDFERWFVSGSAHEWLPGGMTLGLTAEAWDSDDSEISTWGVDLSKELEDEWDLSAGSYYSLFKYQFYLDQEHEDVRTWFGGVRYRPTDRTTLRARYEFEDNDLDGFHTLRLAMTWRF